LPIGLCWICLWRPVRFGLGIGAILLLSLIFQYQSDQRSIYSGRSYFGAFAVKEYEVDLKVDGDKRGRFRYRQLIHGHIDHGMDFTIPEKDRGNPAKDRSRLATTYYHREGPA